MTLSPLLAAATAGAAVAFLHAALPTHWLPFVLVGRSQGWSPRRVMAVTGLAGTGHVLFTAFLGLLLAGAERAVEPWLGQLVPRAVGAVLVVLGVVYLVRQFRSSGHDHAHRPPPLGARSEAAAIAGLVLMLTLSPCEAFLPIYLADTGRGWAGFAVLSLVLALGTAGGMLLFTSLSLAGVERLGLQRLARYEAGVIGVALCALGLYVALEG